MHKKKTRSQDKISVRLQKNYKASRGTKKVTKEQAGKVGNVLQRARGNHKRKVQCSSKIIFQTVKRLKESFLPPTTAINDDAGQKIKLSNQIWKEYCEEIYNGEVEN